ncbi:hypothetical protein ACJIZ3_013782 [Penstemon smallii]|uniref:Plus3 domain-containing protein n=1 Tax=Penstemon smallii TaxID=265156 RepID=A0ABD3RHL3_9LAMI
MAFAKSDPLSELVWSPDNGLSVKCTDAASLADKKFINLRNVGPVNQCLSTSQSVGSEGGRDKINDDEEKSTKSQTILNVGNKFGDTSRGLSDESNGKMEEEAGTADANCKHEGSKDEENEDMCTSQNVTETSKENAGCGAFTDETHDCKADMATFPCKLIKKAHSVEYSRIEPHEAHVCTSLHSIPGQELNDEEVNKDEKKLEFSDENDLGRNLDETRLTQEESLPIEVSPRLHQEKGKQKAISDEKSSNDSHERVESCNGTTLFSKGIKREICGQELVSGSKRKKIQIQGRYGSASVFGHDSSFKTWISNMVKGLQNSNKEKSSSLAHETSEKTRDSGDRSMGFRSMFQSIYCENTKKTEVDFEDHYIEDNKTSLESLSMMKAICNGKTDNSLEMPICNQEKGEVSPSDTLFKPVNITAIDTSPTSPLATINTSKKSNPLSSLWITRLYNRAPNIENDHIIECQKENDGNRKADILSIDLKSSKPPSPIVHSRSSEDIASVFARRLDALRHIIQPETGNYSTCLFCGRNDHDLRGCREVTETELENLLEKNSSFERVVEFPSICIRCFQLDHWAISCPLVSSTRHRGEDQDLRLCNFVSMQSRVVPAEMVNAVRKLCLSRCDILRWMNSNDSLSHLNGFFVRLRLGKLETGLEGTGYHVACIIGDSREHIGCRSKKSILVDIGGIKSSVVSRYISNNGFLEDEIDVWWSRIGKSGGKIPSLDKLNSKYKERKDLGF